MKKILLLLLLLCVSLNGMSQISKTTQDITKLDGRYKIRCNKRIFNVDTTTVIVKLKDLKASCNIEYKVLRQNKLGFVDIQTILSFYENCGFEQSHRVKNFFADNYDHPIFEEGVQFVDMVYLKKDL